METVEIVLVITTMVISSLATYLPPSPCFQYQDPAAKYKLRDDKEYYPTQEVNLVLTKYPYMKEMFYEDAHSYISVPLNPSQVPLANVCPYHKHTLYSFFYANKDCYVIYPDVQKVTYTQCSTDYHRNCQQCSYPGGVSKCVEDYDYRYVWAYCTHGATPRPVDPYPSAHPVDPYPKPEPVPRPEPVPTHKPHVYPNYNKPTYPILPKPYPYPYTNMWNSVYKPYASHKRWKRSYHNPPEKTYGTIERLALYLPHHCGCKTYRC